MPNGSGGIGVPGRKSDVNDAAWIAGLLTYGLISASYVPPQPIQELRGLTRTRKQLVREILSAHPKNAGSGRYIDRLERRKGEWRIALRRAIVDTVIAGDASMLRNPAFKDMGYTRGTWDKTDVSYDRPLKLETPTMKW